MPFPAWFDRLDNRITHWMARRGITLTRVALGVVFIWFGTLKYFPGLSPATALAAPAFERLTLGLIPGPAALIVLATWEVAIGLGLLTGRFLRVVLLLLFVQMVGAMSPLVLLPGETWRAFPYAPTLEGQYIIKNLVLIGAALVVGATVRGGYVKPEPESGERSSGRRRPQWVSP